METIKNRILQIYQPRKISFGNGCLKTMVNDLLEYQLKKILIVTLPAIQAQLNEAMEDLKKKGVAISFDLSIEKEPAFDDYERVLKAAKQLQPEAVIGIGGGSIMDVAKLVAAQLKNTQALDDIIGSNKLDKRETLLICLPTTAGTGSEASPNAIFVDNRDDQKKGVISPELVPDLIYVDPALSEKLPPAVTAATGLDALTHCIEAYTNRFAHPFIDTYALEGIRLISENISAAYHNGSDMKARAAMALGSLYGGICLGPVNTAAVHALSYPLGSRFHIAHGLSNAILLPHVMRFNLSATPERYAAIAKAMGAKGDNVKQLAEESMQKIIQLMEACDMPLQISALDIPKDAINTMAEEAMQITRLLKNNPREMSLQDAIDIYNSAY